MNPLTNVKNIQKLNDKVLQMGVEDNISWHKQYKDSAYIFIGGLPYDLTEGDILCVFSQYGEIVDVNLVREKSSGKSKGYGFLCYEDQRSTILAVDNLNGIKLGDRTIRVDHVSKYRRPKGEETDEGGDRKELPLVSCAPKTPPTSEEEQEVVVKEGKKKKRKKEKSKKRLKDNKKGEESVKEMKSLRKRDFSPSLERERKKRKEENREDGNGDNLKEKNKKSLDGKLGREIGQEKSLGLAKESMKDMRREKERDIDNYTKRDKNNDSRKEKDGGRDREREKQRDRDRR